MQIFIDTDAGDANTINSLVDADGTFQNFSRQRFDPFCCGGLEPPQGGNNTGSNFGALQRMNGLTFDTGFERRLHAGLIVTQGTRRR